MRKIGTIYLSVIIALLAVWLLPRLYRIITAEGYSTPFTLYSCVINDFTALEDSRKGDLLFKDTAGREYGDTVQPLFYHRAQKLDGTARYTINGRTLTDEEIETNNIYFTSSPEDVNADMPPVYLMLESDPPRGDLQDAEYAFVNRKNGPAMIRIEDNTEDKALSEAFRTSMAAAGFKFPAVLVNGNPNTRKAYDEGYLMTDSEGGLFHIKLLDGQPSVEHIQLPDSIDIKHVSLIEHDNRASIAYLTDSQDRFYIIDSLRTLHPTDVKADLSKQNMMLVGDVFHYTVKVSDSDGESFWALRNGDFSTVKTLRRDYPESTVFDLPKYIFPVQLSMTSSLDGWVRPRFYNFSWIGLVVDVIAVGLFFGLRARAKRRK